jgi:nitroreductase
MDQSSRTYIAHIQQAIANRRSFALGDLSDQPVERAHITQILEAANWAPSHGKTEPWRFVVYTGAARQQLGAAFGSAFRLLNPQHAPGSEGEQAQIKRAWQAPVWIALGMHPSGKMPEWEDLVAFGCAVHTMHLMASALGLAAKWTSGAVVMHPHVAEVVGFAPATKLYGFLYVGHPAVPWPTGVRQPIETKVRWADEHPIT